MVRPHLLITNIWHRDKYLYDLNSWLVMRSARPGTAAAHESVLTQQTQASDPTMSIDLGKEKTRDPVKHF